MKGSRRYVGIAVVVLALVFLAACGGDDVPSGGGTTPPVPTQTTFEEPEWTIVTPVGWTREDITGNADAKKAIRYKGSNGDYVIVHIDPMGSDFSYDALWRYEVKGQGFEIVEKYECKGTADETCSDDDNRYDAYVLWRSGAEPPKVGGHTWYFAFGNSTTTTVDLNLFEQVIESVRVEG
jgi:hypothetical protein